MEKIILDTNVLMAITEFKIDIFTELERICDFKYQLFILSGIVKELEKIIAEQRGKYKLAAKLALQILKAKKVEVLESAGNVDDLLTAYSQNGYLIFTQDVELKKRLTKPYFTIRQKKTVMMMK